MYRKKLIKLKRSIEILFISMKLNSNNNLECSRLKYKTKKYDLKLRVHCKN